MKKMIARLFICLLALSLFPVPGFASEEAKPLSIVCTTFPQYDWVRQILGDKADEVQLTLLLDNGVDLHNYQPTAQDIAAISTCDLFIYVGGESDQWVEKVLETAHNPNLKALSLVASVDAKEEEHVEGMQEDDHGHSHDESFALEDIQERTLADFAGEWQSLHPMMVAGALDAYCQYKADNDDDAATTAQTYREKYTASWACDADVVTIDGDSIAFRYADGTIRSAEYKAAGYHADVHEDDGHISVSYQFETDSDDAPKFVVFSDHGHEPAKAEHFHFYFGDEGFQALLESQTHSFFMPADFTPEQILDELMGHGHEEAEYDEHVWLSLRNAQTLVAAIRDAFCELNPDAADAYKVNADAYIATLADMDARYQAVVDAAQRKTMLFADRFPFRYLADDYKLGYYAAFAGCSAETEASFETIAFLSGKLDELKLPVVLTIEGANHAIAQTVVANSQGKDQKIITMNSIQSVTARDVAAGASYMGFMEENLVALKDALN